jgi:hypothetical protein
MALHLILVRSVKVLACLSMQEISENKLWDIQHYKKIIFSRVIVNQAHIQ